MTSLATEPSRGEGTSGLLRAAEAALRARPPGGPAWLEGRRAEAAAWLSAHGFPTQRDEAYRFTPVRDAVRTPYRMTATEAPVATAQGDGVRVLSLREALAAIPNAVEACLGRIASLTDGFAALSAALLGEALVVWVPPRAAGTVLVSHAPPRRGEPALSLPRVLVLAERESTLTLVESVADGGGDAEHLVVAGTEVSVDDGARVEHVRVHEGTPDVRAVSALSVKQGRDSRYASHVFTFGGPLSRLDLTVSLDGTGAECTLGGLYFAGDGDLVDHHTMLDHRSPRATSRERYKGVLSGNGTAIFDGTVVVRPGASGTEAHQETRNLLLSGDAVVHAKPHLRIDNDDVKCSHGATVGRLDPAALFYLRSRGIDVDAARAVLTVAFARQQIEGVTDEATRRALETRLARSFPGGWLAEEGAP